MAVSGISASYPTQVPIESGVSAAARVSQTPARAQGARFDQGSSGRSSLSGAQPLNTSGPRGTKVNIIA